MTTKRARVTWSSPSTGDFGRLNQLKPIKSPVIPMAVASPVILPQSVQEAVAKAAVAVKEPPKQPRRSIFTVGCSGVETDQKDEKDEPRWEFPYSCFLCKKAIEEDKDVFMFGYLRAFCSTKCRDIQIDLEDKDREPSPVPKNKQNAAYRLP